MALDARARELAAMPYADYLCTPEWQKRRKAALERAGYRCQVCDGRTQLEVHHRTYERRGHEDDADLTVLCDGCHELFHQAGRLKARPVAIGIVQHVPGATIWTLPGHQADKPFYHRRPPLRIVRTVKRRWRRTSSGVRIGWALVLAGAGLLLLLGPFRPI